MPLTPEIDIAHSVIQLETLEDRLQSGERSIKLQAEAQQLIRQTSKAIFLQKSWRQEIIERAQYIAQQCIK